MQTIEERLDQLERRNRRLTAALTVTVMAVAICAVVTMAVTDEKTIGEPETVGYFETVVAKGIRVQNIRVQNDAG